MRNKAFLFLVAFIAGTGLYAAGARDVPSGREPLPVPPLLEGATLNLVMQEGTLKLPMGTSKTMGFNGNYLGPTIRVSNGDFEQINVTNTLKEDSTVHWHGLHVPGKYDGGPHQVVKAGTTWSPSFRINQKAATLWYHPHLLEKTAEQVYNGMAGMFYIEDDYSKSLPIPRTYGVNDFPLIIQDRRLNRKGQFAYNPGRPDIMRGYTGNVVLVNGAYEPFLNLSRGTYRFRILNGSNSSIFKIKFSDDRSFTVIASDGGFLPHSFKTTSFITAPAERYEILVDFASEGTASLITEIYGGDSFKTLDFNISKQKGTFYPHPADFAYTPVVYNKDEDIQRTFRMETRGMGRFTINGKSMDLNRINFSLKKNTTEIWTIESVGTGMMQVPHSFHVHDVQFTVLSVNGKKPGPLYSGPKDTVLLMGGDRIVIALHFQDYTGIYMYHCHFLEHEDAGMMGQFLVE